MQVVAFVDDQVSVLAPPFVTVDGVAVMLMVGAAGVVSVRPGLESVPPALESDPPPHAETDNRASRPAQSTRPRESVFTAFFLFFCLCVFPTSRDILTVLLRQGNSSDIVKGGGPHRLRLMWPGVNSCLAAAGTPQSATRSMVLKAHGI